MRLIKLTEATSKVEFWANPNHIITLAPNLKDGGSFLRVTNRETVMKIEEEPSFVLQLLSLIAK